MHQGRLVRNICSNQLNANDLRSNCIIEKLMQILYDAYTDLQMKMSAQPALCAATVIKTDDVNMFDIVDASATALLVLAKEYQNQLIMKDLDCIGFFVQMFYSNNALIQKAAASLLAELATSKECSEVIAAEHSALHTGQLMQPVRTAQERRRARRLHDAALGRDWCES